jgi:hypothetical protein
MITRSTHLARAMPLPCRLWRLIQAVAIPAFLLCVCNRVRPPDDDEIRPTAVTVDAQAAIATAARYAREKGWKVETYRASAIIEGTTARVSFEGEVKRPGNHFTVLVDTTTGQVTGLIPGA